MNRLHALRVVVLSFSWSGVLPVVMGLGVVLLPADKNQQAAAAQPAEPQAAKAGQGTLWVGGKTYKLEHAVAYETKVFDEKEIAVLLCAKPIPLEKLKTTLQKDKGSDLRFTLFEPYVKLTFDESGKLMFLNTWADNNSINVGGTLKDAKVEVTFPDGQARGKVTVEDAKGDPAYRFDVAFDLAVMKLPAEAAAAKPAAREPKSKAKDRAKEREPAPASTAGSIQDLPIPEGATDIRYNKSFGDIRFTNPSAVKTLVAFYAKYLADQKWTKSEKDTVKSSYWVQRFAKGEASLTVRVEPTTDSGSKVRLTPKGLSWDEPEAAKKSAAAPDSKKGAADKTAKNPTTKPSEGSDLVADDRDGWPVPAAAQDVLETKTRFRRAIQARSNASLKALVEFYRRELPAREWTEIKLFSKTGTQEAELGFGGTQGELVLKLRREGDATLINIASHDRQAASKAGIEPKLGQGKLVIGNGSKDDAVVTVSKQEYKIAAGAGAKDPKDALNLDLQPGKYTVAVKIPGEEVQTETIEISAFETWGIMIAPTGGYAAVQLY